MKWVLLSAVVALLSWWTYARPRVSCVIVWSLVASVFLSAGLILVLPGAFAPKTFWLAFSIPLIWVALQFWSYFDERPWRVFSGLMVLIGLGVLAVVLLQPEAPSPIL